MYKASEIYNVKELATSNIPELIVESDELALSTDPALPIWLKTIRATHSREGVFIILGPQEIISTGFKGTVRIHDVTPTVLYTLGLPIPSYIDGVPVTRLFTGNSMQDKITYIQISYEKAKIKARAYRVKRLKVQMRLA